MTSKIKISLFHLALIVSIISTFSLASCSEENFSTNPKYKLSFSTDTLTFDTVFTKIGSATSKILVYNKNKFALNISKIQLGKGKTSSFRINVDGSIDADNTFTNVEILANDSMYIFIELTVDPTDSNSPFLINDSIVFITNGVIQDLKLNAYGQNMEILKNKSILNDSALNATKPYLIYGDLTVDSTATLTIAPGAKLYFHNNANLVVHGNLKAEGTLEQPISMRGDRLDKIKFSDPFPYNTVSGQWGGIYLLSSFGKHSLKHVNMNSGYFGVYFSNDDINNLPTLNIDNCRIHNFLLYGLVVKNGNLTVTNTEISNTSSYTVFLNGGTHTFIQSTIANYFNNSSVQPVSRDAQPALMLMNMNRTAPMSSVFKNCIISGSASNEFSLATKFIDQYKGEFTNCYIRKTDSLKLSQFVNTRWHNKNDTTFKSVRYDIVKNTYFDFKLDSVSPARGLANAAVANQYPLDLNGNSRTKDGKPDAGAYEWISIKK